jgi:hypothetical protein
MLALSLILLSYAATDCSAYASCNRIGTEAFQAGDFTRAAAQFDRQIDYAETALAEAGGDDEGALVRRDTALNNAALARLRGGECLKARAYLDQARAEARATQANRRQWDSRCAGSAAALVGPVGEYWQYAGHGLWNRISLRETGDETLRLDAFWMRVGRGPMDEYGIKAFGELEQVFVFPADGGASGRFGGIDPEVECRIELRFEPQALEVSHTPTPDCQTGGMGAVLHGRYVLVSTELPDIED